MYVFGCRSSLFRLCDSDFGITPVDDITIGITCVAFCFHIAQYFIRQFLVFTLFISCCFSEIMCIRGSYVYQISGLFFCFVFCFFHESYVRSVSRYCFIRNYAAVPVQPEAVILQYISWCVLIVWTLSSIISATSASFW